MIPILAGVFILLQKFGRISRSGSIMHNCHKGFRHACGVFVLNNIATVDNPRSSLPHQSLRALEDFLIRRLASAPHEERNAAGDLNNLVVQAHVVSRVRLDDIRPQFDGLPHEVVQAARDAVLAEA